MSAIEIVRYPSPVLSTAASAVTDFGDDLGRLIGQLSRALDEAPAIGLAAPHLGVLLRVVVVRLSPELPVTVYVNPRVEDASVATAVHEEGSVSLPGVTETVERPERIRVSYQHADGASGEEVLEGWPAAVLQHEIDQLDGVFWIDRLSRLKRERLIKRWKKLQSRS
ncbi:peptide deformylase [Oryzibacter oryziterrae]|uniref:peptide deformylase n=1 Tax=Oryzibacter oryziterrae TaxID=2766474 RepID=UPI001F007108|nr:peptide deformylase [Oryzibacter oryziterrae]